MEMMDEVRLVGGGGKRGGWNGIMKK